MTRAQAGMPEKSLTHPAWRGRMDEVRTEQSSKTAHRTDRPATVSDIPAATRALCRAFADHPWTRHIIDARDHDKRVREMQELFLTRIRLPHGRGLAQQVFGTAAHPAAMPMDAWREGDKFVVEFD
ncbi:hypothetical protein ACWDPW_30765, partial [Nocardia xishanensis]